MKTRRYSIVVACIAVLVAILACQGGASQPTVSNIRMTTDDSGNTTTTTYSPADVFYAFADISGLKSGQVIEAKWYAVNVEGVDPNLELKTSDFTYDSKADFVYFQISNSNEGGWPAGSYKVEVYLDGTKVGEQAFTVQ
jgi:hypothetical protein